MRGSAKALSTGSPPDCEGRSSVHRVLTALAALLGAFLLLAPASVSAAVVTDRPELFTFDGSDTTAGKFLNPRRLAVDNVSGNVYGVDGEVNSTFDPSTVSKFNADGTAAEFSALGSSTLFGPPGGIFRFSASIAVDNSGCAGEELENEECEGEQGRLYVTDPFTDALIAFAPSGAFLWERNPGEFPGDVAVDTSGRVFVLRGGQVVVYDSEGAVLATLPFGGSNGIDVDANDNLYIASGDVKKYAEVEPLKWELDSTLDPTFSTDVFADQSIPGGHIFTAHPSTGDFNEYEPCTEGEPECVDGNRLVGTYGASTMFASQGIAYNADPPGPGEDRVYVSDSRADNIHAYGPEASGTVPDPAIEATTVIGPGTAEFHGMVNPQSVPNAYYFEWSNSTIGAFRSPLQSLPEDSTPHAVSYKATNLTGEPFSWSVRLVGVNTESKLRQASAVEPFQTPKAADNPAVTIDPVEKEPTAPCTTGITQTTACVSGTIDPQLDSVRWQVEVTTDPACTINFSRVVIDYLSGGEVDTPTPVKALVKNLSPGTHYCARIKANNSFEPFGGGAFSPTAEFETLPVPPSEVSTAFTAPRTDTTAQINGRVNPRGKADFTYQFEWSADGSNWMALPARESTVDSTVPIVVADQLTGLQPDTTYHYRLAAAENETGPAESSGEARTFTTRTSAELTLPPNAFGEPGKRGIELVNSPDKGNQNLFMPFTMVPFLSPDGERAVWSVLAGAPGSPNGTYGQFIAERTGPSAAAPNGWQSRSLQPSAERQLDGGEVNYKLEAATPDLSRFVASLEPLEFANAVEATLSRLDTQQNEDLLKVQRWVGTGEQLGGVDVTDDGAHVLTVDLNTEGEPFQLEDIGAARLGPPAVPGEVVSLMPDGAPSECGLSAYKEPSFRRHAIADSPQWHPGYHWIDTGDASLVYFRAKPNGECGVPWGLYVRDREAGVTTEIAPGGEFVRTTPDGRFGYFLTRSALDPADTNVSADLYRWDQQSEESTCLSCAAQDARIEDGGAFTSTLVSDDFSHIYFHSRAQLIAGEGIAGQRNIYVLSGGALRFVATSHGATLNRQDAQLSADGNALYFRSDADPTLTADEAKGEQLYRYDDRDGGVECLSCVRGSATTLRFGTGGLNEENDFRISADGSTAAFATPEGLVRLDVNRGVDIYEWRNGVPRLLTDGVSEPRSATVIASVYGVDTDGSDILFSVIQPGFTGFEQDELLNLYDARIGGGFVPPASPAHCVEDSCQGPLQAAPSLPLGGSGGFHGSGNLSGPPNCRRPARQAKRLASRAKRLRRTARRAKVPAKARKMRRAARRNARHARGLSKRAKSCRARARSNRRTNR